MSWFDCYKLRNGDSTGRLAQKDLAEVGVPSAIQSVDEAARLQLPHEGIIKKFSWLAVFRLGNSGGEIVQNRPHRFDGREWDFEHEPRINVRTYFVIQKRVEAALHGHALLKLSEMGLSQFCMGAKDI